MRESKESVSTLFWAAVDHLELTSEQQLSLVYDFRKQIDRTCQRYKDLVQDLTGRTNKSIEALALYAATYSTGSISQQLLSELEAKSWIKLEGNQAIEEAVLLSKGLIMREMLAKGRQNFAEEYLKKCLIAFSTQF